MKLGALLTVLLLALGASPASWAGQSWGQLSPAEREILAPLASQWQSLDPASQETWEAIAKRYPRLSAAEQRRLRERMQQWASLSPSEREQVRRGYAQAQRVPLEDRTAKWERFQSLPPEKKQALLERAEARRQAASSTSPAASAPLPAKRPLQGAQARLDERTLLPRKAAASAP